MDGTDRYGSGGGSGIGGCGEDESDRYGSVGRGICGYSRDRMDRYGFGARIGCCDRGRMDRW